MQAEQSQPEQYEDHQPPSALASHKNRAESLAGTLDAWRKVLVRLDAILLWEQPVALAVLLASVTLLFLLLAWQQPPLITLAALACLVAAACDLLVPHASQLLLPVDWSQADERRFADICSRLVHAWDGVTGAAETLACWRRDRPQFYLGITVPGLVGLILLGRFNNLFLAYACVLCLLLVPGLRRSGLLHRAVALLLAKVRGGGRKAD